MDKKLNLNQIRRKCVFCDGVNGTQLTKEHIFPDWLKDIIKDDKYYTTFYRTTESLEPEHVIKMYRDRSSFRKNQGPAISIKKRVVCDKCNNGWMSKIVEEAKPIMIKLINGEKCSIDTHDQKKLANQLGLSLLMSGFLTNAGNPVMSMRSSAEKFYKDKGIDSNWTIYIGNYVGNSTHKVAGITQYCVIGDRDNTTGEPELIGSYPTFNIGHLFVTMHMIQGDFKFVENFCEVYSGKFREEAVPTGLIKLFPFTTDLIKWPPGAFINDQHYDVIERRQFNNSAALALRRKLH